MIRSNQSLVLQKITRVSSGNYSCSAINAEGETVSNQLPLRVKCKCNSHLVFLFHNPSFFIQNERGREVEREKERKRTVHDSRAMSSENLSKLKAHKAMDIGPRKIKIHVSMSLFSNDITVHIFATDC